MARAKCQGHIGAPRWLTARQHPVARAKLDLPEVIIWRPPNGTPALASDEAEFWAREKQFGCYILVDDQHWPSGLVRGKNARARRRHLANLRTYPLTRLVWGEPDRQIN